MRVLLKPFPQSVQVLASLQLKSGTQVLLLKFNPAAQLRHWVGLLSWQVRQGNWQVRTQVPVVVLRVYPGTQAEQEELFLHTRHLGPQGMHLDWER